MTIEIQPTHALFQQYRNIIYVLLIIFKWALLYIRARNKFLQTYFSKPKGFLLSFLNRILKVPGNLHKGEEILLVMLFPIPINMMTATVLYFGSNS